MQRERAPIFVRVTEGVTHEQTVQPLLDQIIEEHHTPFAQVVRQTEHMLTMRQRRQASLAAIDGVLRDLSVQWAARIERRRIMRAMLDPAKEQDHERALAFDRKIETHRCPCGQPWKRCKRGAENIFDE